MSSQENVLIQTQVNFINLHPKYYKKLVYSFNFKNNEQLDYNCIDNIFQEGKNMINEPLSTTDRWHDYVENNGEQSVNDILNLIKENQKQLSKFRAHPVIAYLTAINTNSLPSQINLNDKDVKEFVSLIADIPENEREIASLKSFNGDIR